MAPNSKYGMFRILRHNVCQIYTLFDMNFTHIDACLYDALCSNCDTIRSIGLPLQGRRYNYGIVSFGVNQKCRSKYTVVHDDIHRRRITCLSTTKLHGIVVMMLSWHAKGSGFKPHLKLLLHKLSCEAKVSSGV